MQLTGVRHKGSQCITEKLLLVKFHFFGVHFDGPWANGEGAPPLPVLDEVCCPRQYPNHLAFPPRTGNGTLCPAFNNAITTLPWS